MELTTPNFANIAKDYTAPPFDHFFLDINSLTEAANLLLELSPIIGDSAGANSGAASPFTALEALSSLVPGNSPGTGAIAEFISLTSQALQNQSERVSTLSSYGQSAATALQELVAASVSADTAHSSDYASLSAVV